MNPRREWEKERLADQEAAAAMRKARKGILNSAPGVVDMLNRRLDDLAATLDGGKPANLPAYSQPPREAALRMLDRVTIASAAPFPCYRSVVRLGMGLAAALHRVEAMETKMRQPAAVPEAAD